MWLYLDGSFEYSVMHSRLLDATGHVGILFFLEIDPVVFIHSLVDENWCWFCFLMAVSSAVTNIHQHVLVWASLSPEHAPSGETAGS